MSGNNGQQENRRGGKQRRNKVSVMEASGQTDSERRELRRDFREVAKKLDQNAEQMENPELDTYDVLREENNELYSKVRYTREAVLDSENLDQIAQRASKQVERMIEVSEP